MKKKSLYILATLFISFTFHSCDEDTSISEFNYEAEVIGKSLDCGDFEIKITKEVQNARLIADVSSGDSYTAKNLPENLKIEGLKIKLNIRKIKNIEVTPCTTLGVPYPWVFVTEAETIQSPL